MLNLYSRPPPLRNGPRTDDGIRWVSINGDDNNDGLARERPKRTVAGAVQSLPTAGSGRSARHEGRIIIGRGTFVETELPIEFNAGIIFEGSGTGAGSDSGTIIKQGAADHLFQPAATFTDYHHHGYFKDLVLEGDPRNFEGDYDLINMTRTGFNTAFYNVFFRDAPRYGFSISQYAVNLYLYNCSGAGCIGGWMYLYLQSSANLNNFVAFGTQIDDCGQYPIQVVSDANGVNIVAFDGLETEAASTDYHDAVIFHDRTGGSNPVIFNIKNVAAFRSGGGGTAVCYESDSGWSRWLTEAVYGNGYDKAFVSDATRTDTASSGTIDYRAEYLS